MLKRKRDTTGPAQRPHEWPVKALPSFDSTLHTFTWPHGPAALLEERRTVKEILEAAQSLRMPVVQWPGMAVMSSCCGTGFLGMSVSVDECFVESQAKRNLLVDRAHQLFNTIWKLEVQALTCNAHDWLDEPARVSQRFQHYDMTEEHLYATVDKIDSMRALYDNLKPETVDLMRRCATTNEIRRSMVVTADECGFLN